MGGLKLYCIIGIIFFGYFYPRLLVRAMCEPKPNKKQFIKTKRGYYILYGIVQTFYTVLVYMMAVSMGFFPALNRFDYFMRLTFSDRQYILDRHSEYDDELDKNASYYYFGAKVRGQEQVDLLEDIVINRTYTYKKYQLEGFHIQYDIEKECYLLKLNDVSYCTITVDRKGLLKRAGYKWEDEKLKVRYEFLNGASEY
ncbi:MAG: hypothetical protein J1D87_01595 [Lachnospiraceae bacterium]|nr:hypothetical protein [Lachnospiraceae bacterium]